MNRDFLRQVANFHAMIAVIVVNALANIIKYNGKTTAEISDSFKVYFVPEGYVFAIWGLIYLGLALFAIYQFLPAQRENTRLRRVGYLFVLSCLANIAWLFLWHYEVLIATVPVMLLLLGLLIAIYVRLDIGMGKASLSEQWLAHLPFSIYLGWITVATIANVADLLYYLKWDGFGLDPQIWTAIMLGVAALLALIISLVRGDWAYDLVLIWAIVGIAIKQAGAQIVVTAAWVATGVVAGVMVAGIVLRIVRRRRPI